MKNCEPFVFFPRFAMESRNGLSCFRVKASSARQKKKTKNHYELILFFLLSGMSNVVLYDFFHLREAFKPTHLLQNVQLSKLLDGSVKLEKIRKTGIFTVSQLYCYTGGQLCIFLDVEKAYQNSCTCNIFSKFASYSVGFVTKCMLKDFFCRNSQKIFVTSLRHDEVSITNLVRQQKYSLVNFL